VPSEKFSDQFYLLHKVLNIDERAVSWLATLEKYQNAPAIGKRQYTEAFPETK
jgi:hypothetical protein